MLALWITCHGARDGGCVQLNVAQIRAFAVANDATRILFVQNERSVTSIDVSETPDEIAASIGEANGARASSTQRCRQSVAICNDAGSADGRFALCDSE